MDTRDNVAESADPGQSGQASSATTQGTDLWFDSAVVPDRSPEAGGMVWYDSQTRTVTLWVDGRTIVAGDAPEDSPEAVDAILTDTGWRRGSGFAFAADSTVLRYAAIDPLPAATPHRAR